MRPCTTTTPRNPSPETRVNEPHARHPSKPPLPPRVYSLGPQHKIKHPAPPSDPVMLSWFFPRHSSGWCLRLVITNGRREVVPCTPTRWDPEPLGLHRSPRTALPAEATPQGHPPSQWLLHTGGVDGGQGKPLRNPSGYDCPVSSSLYKPMLWESMSLSLGLPVHWSLRGSVPTQEACLGCGIRQTFLALTIRTSSLPQIQWLCLVLFCLGPGLCTHEAIPFCALKGAEAGRLESPREELSQCLQGH